MTTKRIDTRTIDIPVVVWAEYAPGAGILAEPTARELRGRLTTDHAASSYGRRVLVDGAGNAYGAVDLAGRTIRLDLAALRDLTDSVADEDGTHIDLLDKLRERAAESGWSIR